MIYSPIIAIELFIFIFLFGPLSMLNLTIRYCSLLKFERLYAKFNFENVYSGCTQNGKIICKGTIVRVSILCTGCPKKTLLKEKLITSLRSGFFLDTWYIQHSAFKEPVKFWNMVQGMINIFESNFLYWKSKHQWHPRK